MNGTKEGKLSNEAQILILDQAIGKIINIFLDTFLAAYFYKISKQNVYYLSLYNIVGWFVATIGAFLVGDFIKRKNKVSLYRFGTFVKALYVFVIMILGEKIVDYVYLIGVMFGLSTATTGFPYNMIESENITKEERSKYIGFASVATEIISLIIPILLGAYITFQSYQVAAMLIFVFSILKVILTFFIRNQNIQNSRVNLKEFYAIVKRDAVLKKLYGIEFLKGITRYGVMSLIVSLLMIYQTDNDLELGSWTSFFSFFTMITMYLFGKYYQPKQKKKLLTACLFAIIISFVAVLYSVNLITVIVYNMVYYIFMNILLKITEVNLFDYSNQEPFKDKFNTEYFIFRELFLNLGRMLGYAILLFTVGIAQNLDLLNILFGLIVISIVVIIRLSNQLAIKEEK